MAIWRTDFVLRTMTLWVVMAGVALAAKPSPLELCLAADGYNDPDQAIEACSAVIDKGTAAAGDLSRVYGKRADAFYFRHRNDYAAADLDRALKLDAHNITALVRRANNRIVTGNFNAGLEDINQALFLDPDHANAYIALAWLYSFTDPSNAKGIAAYNRALEIDPEHPLALLNLATIYGLEGRDSLKGLAYIDRLIALGPDRLAGTVIWRQPGFRYYYDFYGVARSNRGRMYAKLKRNGEALADFNWLIEHHPKVASAYVERSRIYAWGLQDMNRAIADAETAATLEPEREEPRFQMFSVLAAQKRHAEALRVADELMKGGLTQHVRSQIYWQRAYIHKALGDADQAMTDMEAYFLMVPDGVKFMQTQLAGNGYYTGDIDGEYSEAVRNGLRACFIDPAC